MQDVVVVGHTGGVSTMLVPGSGEPNFDSYVADPYQRARARQEQEVHQLMDKLQPDMIVVDPTTIGQVSCCLCSLVSGAWALGCCMRVWGCWLLHESLLNSAATLASLPAVRPTMQFVYAGSVIMLGIVYS